MADILLLTGRPGVGKTTFIRRLAADLGRSAGGFYTEEIRKSGDRVGFRLVTLDGHAAIFAHTDWVKRMRYRVGRYGVDLAVLDRIGLVAVRTAVRRRQAILGRRAHHRWSVLGWPWRVDFSRAEALLIASNGRATSMSFLRRGVIRRGTRRPREASEGDWATAVGVA